MHNKLILCDVFLLLYLYSFPFRYFQCPAIWICPFFTLPFLPLSSFQLLVKFMSLLPYNSRRMRQTAAKDRSRCGRDLCRTSSTWVPKTTEGIDAIIWERAVETAPVVRQTPEFQMWERTRLLQRQLQICESLLQRPCDREEQTMLETVSADSAREWEDETCRVRVMD